MSTPFHDGELAVQARAGVLAEARQVSRVISRTIPAGIGRFLAERPFLVAASVDEQRRVWASLLVGEPGFVEVADPSTVRIAARPHPHDPLAASLAPDRPIGLLAIDLGRRARARVNGLVGAARAGLVEVRVSEVFPNCPSYIQPRAVALHDRRDSGDARRAAALDDGQRTWIAGADTFFIASGHPERGADVSHRGGQPGFVRVESGTCLRFPDYAGNNMFQTLGNLAIDPRVGLLFVDFASGKTLQLTGTARVDWEASPDEASPHADRHIEVEIGEVVELAGGNPDQPAAS